MKPSGHPTPINRRQFLGHAACATLASLAGGCTTASRTRSQAEARIAFNTANLVARVSGYRYRLESWGDQHRKTVAATDEAAWTGICREISGAGFRAIEIWEAHASPETMTFKRASTWKTIMSDHGLRPVAYAGRLSRKTADICQWLNIPHIDGNIGGLRPDQAREVCHSTGVRFNTENHPEKTFEQIVAPIGGGNEWLGVCIDTGWLGTQGADVPDIILQCRSLVRHCHVKDVLAVGSHQTCPLGTGVANVEAALRAFHEIGYTGWYSWEDEPEDRNPFDSAVRNREWLADRIRRA
jgi:sugar phosphate isomerase/epimerase